MKKKILTMISICSMFLLPGCLADTYALTDEEQGIIAEYAAGVLLRNDDYYLEALVTPTPTPSPLPTVSPEPTKAPATDPAPSGSPDNSSAGNGQTEEYEPNATMSEVYGLAGVQVEYMGISILESYSETADKSYMVNVEPGHKLAKVDIKLTNTAGIAQEIDFGSLGVEYRLDYGNRHFAPPLITAISNDLLYLDTTILAGESKECCLFFQIGEDGLKDGKLILSREDHTSIISLD